MSKRNIAYVKPQDPSFLAKLKQQIGYNEGPSVETKRQKLEDLEGDSSDSEERPEREDEKPLVVVLKSGDLTAEEAVAEEQRLTKEAAEAPADLEQPIVFRKRHKPKEYPEDTLTTSPTPPSKSNKGEKRNKEDKCKKVDTKITAKLSFNADEEEEEE